MAVPEKHHQSRRLLDLIMILTALIVIGILLTVGFQYWQRNFLNNGNSSQNTKSTEEARKQAASLLINSAKPVSQQERKEASTILKQKTTTSATERSNVANLLK